MQAVILAGKGTRLTPLTLHTPKPIEPIANRPFLLYQIDLLKRVEIIQLIRCLSYQPRKIEEMLGIGRPAAGLHTVVRQFRVQALACVPRLPT